MTRKKTDTKHKGLFLKILLVLFLLGALGLLSAGLMNNHIINSTRSDVYSLPAFEEIADNEHYEAVIVLGCAVWDDGPSPMLTDRLRTGAAVFKTGCADYIIVSGDSKEPEKYDETGAMKKFLVEQEGIDADKIVCDPLGLSTYETMLRAVAQYNVSSAVVVTTDFHCCRTLYDSRSFGIRSIGVEAINSGYVIRQYNYYREFIARCKDFVFTLIKPGY